MNLSFTIAFKLQSNTQSKQKIAEDSTPQSEQKVGNDVPIWKQPAWGSYVDDTTLGEAD